MSRVLNVVNIPPPRKKYNRTHIITPHPPSLKHYHQLHGRDAGGAMRGWEWWMVRGELGKHKRHHIWWCTEHVDPQQTAGPHLNKQINKLTNSWTTFCPKLLTFGAQNAKLILGLPKGLLPMSMIYPVGLSLIMLYFVIGTGWMLKYTWFPSLLTAEESNVTMSQTNKQSGAHKHKWTWASLTEPWISILIYSVLFIPIHFILFYLDIMQVWLVLEKHWIELRAMKPCDIALSWYRPFLESRIRYDIGNIGFIG